MRKRPVFISFLLSYAILLSVIMLITAGIYARVLNMMVSEIHDTYDRFLKQTGNDVDAMLEGYHRIALGLAMQLKIEALAVNKQPLDAEQRQIMIDVYNILRNVGTGDASIERAYLYLPWKGAVLSSNGFSGIQEFYENYTSIWFDSQDDWLNMMKDTRYNEIICCGDKLFFVVALPVGRVNAYEGAIVLQVDSSSVMTRLDAVTSTYRGATAVVDKTGQVILAHGKQEELFRQAMADSSTSRFSFGNNNILINRIASTASSWEYISVVFEDDLLNKALISRNIMVASGSVCVVLGILLALLFSRKNYLPLQHLLELFGKNDTAVQTQKINEYRYMERVLSTFIKEKDMMAEQLREHWQELRDQFLRRLLKGYLREPVAENPEFKVLGLDFENMWKAVFLLGGVEDSNLPAAVSGINKAVYPGTEVTCFDMDDLICGIISCRSKEPSALELRRTAEVIYETAALLAGEGICIGYSKPCMQMDALPIVYEEARQALEFKQLLDGEGIAGIDDLPDKDSSTNISFHDQIKLQNALIAGNYNEAGKIFNDIITRYFPDTGIPTQMIKCRMFSLINTIILSISETNIQRNDTFWENMKPVDKLLKCNTVRELTRESQAIFRKLNSMMEESRIKLLGQKQLEINRFLLENYRNPDLSVAMIADHFDMHPTYLSRQFKQLNHLNLLERIHGLRIEEAKCLMENPNTSMREISGRIGYNNELSFFRAFKRLEGVTPSQYKSRHTEEMK